MVQEIEKLIQKHDAQKVAIKGFEGRLRGKTYAERVELEAAVYIAWAVRIGSLIKRNH